MHTSRPSWRDQLQGRLPDRPMLEDMALFDAVRNLRMALFTTTGQMPGQEPRNYSTRRRYIDKHYDELRVALQHHMRAGLKYDHARTLCQAMFHTSGLDGLTFANALHRVMSVLAKMHT